jgi:hypothetical protein
LNDNYSLERRAFFQSFNHAFDLVAEINGFAVVQSSVVEKDKLFSISISITNSYHNLPWDQSEPSFATNPQRPYQSNYC